MTPMRKVWALFIDSVDSGWGAPAVALFEMTENKFNDWIGYHLWVGGPIKRHFQVWPVNSRFMKTWS